MLNEVKKAKQDYFVICEIYPKINHDEQEYDMVCYHIQQCLEKLLKALISLKGEQYQYTHNIMKLCNQIEQLYFDNEDILDFIENNIKPNATMYTTWKSQSRYNVDFIELRKNVEDGFDIIEKMFDLVEKEEQKLNYL